MSKPPENTLKKWRLSQAECIIAWRKKVEELRVRSFEENWHYERMEMEIARLLDKDLREIWDFASYYVYRTRTGDLRQMFADALKEIRDCGTLEPSWKNRLLKAIQTTKKKMKR